MKKTKRIKPASVYNKVVLVGPGLIAGSLILDLKNKKKIGEVVCYARQSRTQKNALRKKIANRIGTDLPSDLRQADLIILGTPVLTTLNLIKMIAKHAPSTALIVDVGSTKLHLVELAGRVFKSGNFVPCHPMAGKETSGPESATKNLFQGKICVLTPYQGISEVYLKKATALWKATGARLLSLPASEHDQIVAVTSHLPQLVASALMNVVGKNASGKKLNLLVGSGLRDTARLAASSASMWTEIVLDNRGYVRPVLESLVLEIKTLLKSLTSRDRASIEAFFLSASNFHKRIVASGSLK